MAPLTEQQSALLRNKYWDLRDEHAMLQLAAYEKDQTIAQLRRDLVNAQNKIAKLEQIIDPMSFISSQ